MRIAFTGAHRVGKTSLAEIMAACLPGYSFIQEPYRQLEEKGYQFAETPTIDDYITQFNLAIQQTEAAGENILFDRCPLDLLAYIHALDKTKNIASLYTDMSEALSQIDLLVFVPIETPDRIHCQESDLPRLRFQVNDILEDWINDLPITIITVKGSLENRKQQVLDNIL
jgi:predicted ATPase